MPKRRHQGLGRDARVWEVVSRCPGLRRADVARRLGWNRMRVTRAVRSLMLGDEVVIYGGRLYITDTQAAREAAKHVEAG